MINHHFYLHHKKKSFLLNIRSSTFILIFQIKFNKLYEFIESLIDEFENNRIKSKLFIWF